MIHIEIKDLTKKAEAQGENKIAIVLYTLAASLHDESISMLVAICQEHCKQRRDALTTKKELN